MRLCQAIENENDYGERLSICYGRVGHPPTRRLLRTHETLALTGTHLQIHSAVKSAVP